MNEIATVTNNAICGYAENVDKKAFYNAINSTDVNLSDCINKVIKVKSFLFVPAQITDMETGEIIETERVVVFDADGNSYYSTAQGLLSSFKNLAVCFPSTAEEWKDGLDCKIEKRSTKKGQTYIVTLV